MLCYFKWTARAALTSPSAVSLPPASPDQATDDYDDDDLDAAGVPLGMDVGGGVHVSMPQTTFDDLLDSVSTVQSFTVDQVEAMMVGARPSEVYSSPRI